MELPFEAVFPFPPAEVFARLRAFARFYPDLHPAHEPHPAGAEVPLLGPGVRFTVAERFGAERRVYDFQVVCFDEAAPRITLAAATLTTIGPLRLRSTLTVDWRIEAHPSGARVVALQTVRLARPWLARWLLSASVRRKLVAHVAEESARAQALMTEAPWPAAK